MRQTQITTIKNNQERVVQLDWFPPNGRSLAPGEEVVVSGKLADQFSKGTGRMKLDSYLRDIKEGLISVQVSDAPGKVVDVPVKKEIVQTVKQPKASPCRGGLVAPAITNAPAAPVINPCLTAQGSVTVVIPYLGDKQLIPGSTGTGNFKYAGLMIGQTPVGGGYVGVSVNGLEVFLANGGDGRDTADCYFSGDNGLTARAMADIVAGDRFYWNNTNAGYPLDIGDLVDFYYMYSTVTPCPT